jgi:hypothetical protein
MGIFRRRDNESMDPQELLARGHADMAESSAAPADDLRGGRSATFRLTVVDVFTIRARHCGDRTGGVGLDPVQLTVRPRRS